MAKKNSKKWVDIVTDMSLAAFTPFGSGLVAKKVAETVFDKDIRLSSLLDDESPYYDDMSTKRLEELANKSDAAACYILAKRDSEGIKAKWHAKALHNIKRLNIDVIFDKVGLAEWLIENDKIEIAMYVAEKIDANYSSAVIYEKLFDKTGEETFREETIERLKASLSERQLADDDRIEAYVKLAKLSTNSKQERHYLIGALKKNSVDSRKQFNKVNDYVINCFDLAYEEMQEKTLATSNQGDSSEDMTDMLFTSIDFNERQFIYFAKNQRALAGCYDESLPWVFTLDKYPKEIQFPTIGHPQPNTIYIAHPVKRGLYLPLENANAELFHDKVHDFVRLSQCLGATEILFHSVKGQLVSEGQSKTQNIEIGGDYKGYGGNMGYNNRRNTSRKEGRKDQEDKVLIFKPSKHPYVPNDINWLSTDSEWKSLVKQRLEGNMLHYRMRISSKKTMTVTDSRMDEVKLAFQSFIANAHVNYSQQMEHSFQHEDETEWEIKVTFKPLEEFKEIKGGGNIDQHDLNTKKASVETMQADFPQYTENERKYLDDLKDFFEDDAEITPRERKMLDKRRQEYGISAERAMELEASLQRSRLTEDEQVNHDMYQDMQQRGK